MTGTLDGREALNRLDTTIAATRQALADAIAATDAGDTRRAEVRDSQVEAYRALAALRFDLVQRAEGLETLDRLHRDAAALLDEQDRFVADVSAALDAAAARIAGLEAARAEKARALDAAVETYETRVAEVEASLGDDPAYKALLAAAEETASVVARAEQKLEIARADRRHKGAPYDADPLFSYLWSRKFRTPSYKAWPVTRLLDHWVARLCGYDKASLNYARLTELPERLAEHAAKVAAKHAAAADRLEEAEAAALARAGTGALKTAADALRQELAGLEQDIEAAEIDHRDLAERHESALKNGSGPAQKARQLLEHGLKAASFPDLRVLAAETVDLEDDRIIDALVKLRAEEMSLDLEAERNVRLPSRRRQELEELDRLRRRFKREHLDSPYASFQAATIDTVLRGLLRGELDADRALRHLGRGVRRRDTRSSRGFGGHERLDTLGLPDILGDVVWEIAKEAGRQGSRGTPWSSGSPRRRAPPRSFPRTRGSGGGSKGGGFRTGGGF